MIGLYLQLGVRHGSSSSSSSGGSHVSQKISKYGGLDTAVRTAAALLAMLWRHTVRDSL
jgi:hypothetical protein